MSGRLQVGKGLSSAAALPRFRHRWAAVAGLRIWRFRTGSPWRDMPAERGAWQAVYHRFLQWRDAGVFEWLMDAMMPRRHGGAKPCYACPSVNDRNASATFASVASLVTPSPLSTPSPFSNSRRARRMCSVPM